MTLSAQADAAMSGVVEETFYANARYWGGLNASFLSTGNLCAMNTGIDSADLNMVWNEKPLAASDSNDVGTVKKYFQNLSLPFWWWLFPSARSSESEETIKNCGFSRVTSIPSMAAELTTQSSRPSGNTAITIHTVTSPSDLAVWEDVSFGGFEFPTETRKQYTRFTGSFNLAANSPQKFFMAFYEGKPVGTSLLFLHKNMAGLYFITTLADFRKKGIGLNLTLATLHFAASAGARYATLQSSPDGFRIYQQAGFREICRVDVYAPISSSA